MELRPVGCICLLIISGISAYGSSRLKAATGATPPATHTKVSIDQKFSKEMADRAGLDRDSPQLSSDGARSGLANPDQKVASTECLLEETIVAQKNAISVDSLNDFCTKVRAGTNVSSAMAELDEHAGTRIDDAIIHIVSWNSGKAQGTWYQYSRHLGKWSGKLISATHDAVLPIDHILGHGNVAFLALHLGIDDTCKISYDVAASHTKPLNQQDVADLIQLAEDYYNKGKAPAGGAAGAAPAKAFDASNPGTPYWGVWGGIVLLKLPSLPASIKLTPSTGGAESLGALAPDPANWDVTTTCSKKTSEQQAASSIQQSGDSSFGLAVSKLRLKSASYAGSDLFQQAEQEPGAAPVPRATSPGRPASGAPPSGGAPKQAGLSQPAANAGGAQASSKDPRSYRPGRGLVLVGRQRSYAGHQL